VTGPSFTSSTSIEVPNTPVATGTPRSRSSRQNRPYSSSASSGRAAPLKLGLLPFAVSSLRQT
jgi:hypothetical protein